ncbi:MAG: hypothetical protein LBE83_01780 [Propionibacteriaceae bacterium]|nr:hypothetical protein [Propionibacteriaceae bacterium]
MSLDIPIDLVQTAETKLTAAETDLKTIIANTKANALENLIGGVSGPIQVACQKLIEDWRVEADAVTAKLEEFNKGLTGVRTTSVDNADTQAGLIADISARMGGAY